jgi:cobalamin biosynthesis protein CbiD
VSGWFCKLAIIAKGEAATHLHVSGQLCEGLATAAAHAHKQGMAARLLENMRNAGHVL